RTHDGIEHAVTHDTARRARGGVLRIENRAARDDQLHRPHVPFAVRDLAVGQFTAAATCADVPVKSIVMLSPSTTTSTAMRNGSGWSPTPSIQSSNA